MSSPLLALLLFLPPGVWPAGAQGSAAGTPPGQVDACASGAPEVVVRSTYVMGTRFHLRVEACERVVAEEAGEAALRAVEEMEALLSTWSPTTPLSQVNAAPAGETVRPGAELGRLLAEVEAWARRTDRAFEPAVGALVDAWDLRGEGRRPDEGALAAALAATGPSGLSVAAPPSDDPSAEGRTPAAVTRHHAAAWLDSGGFGKGAALREAARVLRAHGVRRALLDLGGQLLAVGAPGTPPWPVEVAHPLRRDEAVLELSLLDASVATSGLSERGIEVEGERLGHILDPRTGRPAPAWGSVTVVASDPLVADVLSTALYVLGPEEGMRWARAREDVGVLTLRTRTNGPPMAEWNDTMERWLAPQRPVGDDPAAGPSKTLHDSLEGLFKG